MSPQQGGLFQSMIKQTKKVLRVTEREQALKWNKMSTVLSEVECLVNTRSLEYPSNNANDPQPFRKNHIILGRATAEIADARSLLRSLELSEAV